MTIASFEGKTPRIGAGTYVHPSADVFGDVTIGKECWIDRRVTGEHACSEQRLVEDGPDGGYCGAKHAIG